MTLPTSRGAYADYYKIWEAAMADPSGVRFRVHDYDAAIFHRHRLHKARSIDKDESRALYEPGDPRYNVSPYDRYMIVIRRKRDSDDFYLLVAPRTLGIIGEIESLTGTEYEAQWQTSLEHESPPLLTPLTGTKLLETSSASTSEQQTEPSSSTPSTNAEVNLPTSAWRRL